MPPRNPNPKTEHLMKTARPKMPEGYKSDVLRIQAAEDAWAAFAELTPRQRGEVVQAWFERREAAGE